MAKQPHARCGSKTRAGTPCKNGAMANGRCRMHGGKSTGAPKQNKNAVTTGEHETIWLDTLDDDERVLFDVIKTDVLQQLDEEIRLMTIRERRMMQRISDLRKGPEMIVSDEQEGTTPGQHGPVEFENTRMEPAVDRIQRIEEALTRVQEKKGKLLELKHKVESSKDPDDVDKLDELLKAMMANASDVQSETS